MKFKNSIAVTEIAKLIDAKLIGNKELMITGMNEIHKVESGDLLFVNHPKYYDKVLNSAGSAVIIDSEENCPEGKAILVCADPFKAYNDLAHHLNPIKHLSKSISDDLVCGKNTIIEPGVVIAENCVIGERCHIQAGAYIGKDTVIGDDVNIQPNAIIASDAFYFNKTSDGYEPWRSVGRVVLENRVYIGSGSTINRGVSGDTVIGEGSKIDCLVQIGHGVVLGKNCLLAAQVGIGGKSILGDRVVLYGQVGIAQRIHIGDDVVVLAKSGVSKNLEAGKTYFGYPAAEAREKYKELAALRNVPKLLYGSKKEE